MRKVLNTLFAVIVAAGLSGCGGSNTFSPTFTDANGGSFDLFVSPGTRTINQGDPTTYALNVIGSGGFGSPVTLTADGLPAGAQANISPSPVTPTKSGTDSTLTITTNNNKTTTPAGTYTITVTGSGGGITKQRTVTLFVNAPQQNPTGGIAGTIQ